ncbi:TPA: hypothetical protein ACFRHE_000658 [Neisseria lactamica]
MPSEVPPLQADNASDGIFNGCFHGFKYCAGRRELWHNAALSYLGHREFAVVFRLGKLV